MPGVFIVMIVFVALIAWGGYWLYGKITGNTEPLVSREPLHPDVEEQPVERVADYAADGGGRPVRR